jgi:probable aminopeptidase NPEPL1
VCERKNGIASAAAVSRCFPLYSSKTGESKSVRNVTVAFAFTDDSACIPSHDEIVAFNILGESIRLTAKIIDTPCAEMTTDNFLEVNQLFNYFLTKLFLYLSSTKGN